jgi:tRNA modification GTPase
MEGKTNGRGGGHELAAEELRLAATALGHVTGHVDVEELLDVIFSDFCIGK